MLADKDAAFKLLSSITQRQRDVLDLVLQHRTSKEIARRLDIAPNTVDQRINAARLKLGARDRAETARMYAQLKLICGETTYEPPVVPSNAPVGLDIPQDDQIEPVFILEDHALRVTSPWTETARLVVSEARVPESKLWRLAMIFGIAAGVMVLGTTILAVIQSLNTLL